MDNGTNLNNTMITELGTQLKIKHHNSSLYRPKMNGEKDFIEDDDDIQRLARDINIFSSWLSHFSMYVN